MVDIWYMHMVVDGITKKINYTHSSVQKNIIGSVTKYVTDGTENLGDYYPCITGRSTACIHMATTVCIHA
jgi:hypothetical protein